MDTKNAKKNTISVYPYMFGYFWSLAGDMCTFWKILNTLHCYSMGICV
jgi:hypothetical protein